MRRTPLTTVKLVLDEVEYSDLKTDALGISTDELLEIVVTLTIEHTAPERQTWNCPATPGHAECVACSIHSIAAENETFTRKSHAEMIASLDEIVLDYVCDREYLLADSIENAMS